MHTVFMHKGMEFPKKNIKMISFHTLNIQRTITQKRVRIVLYSDDLFEFRSVFVRCAWLRSIQLPYMDALDNT